MWRLREGLSGAGYASFQVDLQSAKRIVPVSLPAVKLARSTFSRAENSCVAAASISYSTSRHNRCSRSTSRRKAIFSRAPIRWRACAIAESWH